MKGTPSALLSCVVSLKEDVMSMGERHAREENSLILPSIYQVEGTRQQVRPSGHPVVRVGGGALFFEGYPALLV